MADLDRQTSDADFRAWHWRAWGTVLVVLCVWAAWRIGAFNLQDRIQFRGQSVPVDTMWATVDHPFHVSRAATLLHSLQDGEILRWIGHHQGGYPVEFYPLGVPWLDVIVWALSFGSISILAAHKIVITIILLLPALAYWLLARGDQVHPGVAVLATAIHLAVPGFWLNGGYEELVGWGLVTNVAGASFGLLGIVGLIRYVLNREPGMGILALGGITLAAVCNPRSLFAIVIASVAVFVVGAIRSGRSDTRGRLVDPIVRIGVVGALALFIAAPVIVALIQYNDLYYFKHYEFYEPLKTFWDAAKIAVTPNMAKLAVVGVVLPLVPIVGRHLRVQQALALTLGLYVLFTMWVATTSNPPPLVEQLEAPRLMPFQRLLMCWFAALAVGVIVRLVTLFLGRRASALSVGAVLAILSGAMLWTHIMSPSTERMVIVEEYGLRPVPIVATPDFLAFEHAVQRADAELPDGTRVFVVGNQQNWWHEQLWGPTYSDASFFYDDWMWYWHTRQPGPYDPTQGYYYLEPSEAFTQEYFEANAIGVVMVTDMYTPSGMSMRASARDNGALEFVETVGYWDIYRVRETTPIATNGTEQPSEMSFDAHGLTARFDDGNGAVVIRQNWFPRWEATANGEPVDVMRREDGFIELRVPEGPVEIELRYGVTGMDWLARGMSVIGVVGVGMFIARGNRWVRVATGEERGNVPG